MTKTGEKLMQIYFNYAYNLVYDFTTGRFNRYRQLQESCVSQLRFKDNDRVLCVGIGTGNEIYHILRRNRSVSIVGVDYSHTALRKAYGKALALGKEIELSIRDARVLQFPAESFDKVLCIHLMDFVQENEEVTGEILRVLKRGGQFVITYPSDKESLALGFNVLREGMMRSDKSSGKHRTASVLKSLAQMTAGIVYVPLLLRPHKRCYSRAQLQMMLTQLAAGYFQIEEDTIYRDFIVYGEK